MPLIDYIIRCIIISSFTWFCVRILGKKSIAQMTSYDFTAILVLANIASEPLVYKVTAKAFLGTLTITVTAMLIGWLSLNKKFYNVDSKPSVLINDGIIDKMALKRNKMNLPFLLSLLRLKGYTNVSDVEFAILEPDGNLSVLPKSQSRPVQPKDLRISTGYEGLALPLIIDGEVQYNNLKYANLTTEWLYQAIKNAGANRPEEVFLAELTTAGKLTAILSGNNINKRPDMF